MGNNTQYEAYEAAMKRQLTTHLKAKGIVYDFDGEPILDYNSAYAIATNNMVNGWMSAFAGSNIPLAVTANLRLDDCSADNKLLDTAFASNLILNPGLNAKDHHMTREYYNDWKSTYGVKVGWGGITPGMMGATPSRARIQAALEGFGYLTEI